MLLEIIDVSFYDRQCLTQYIRYIRMSYKATRRTGIIKMYVRCVIDRHVILNVFFVSLILVDAIRMIKCENPLYCFLVGKM